MNDLSVIEHPSKSKRLDYVDISRGIVIILVIVGHLVDYGNMAYRMIYVFHMPFFFLISGWCSALFPNKVGFMKFTTGCAKRLLIPALIARIIEAFATSNIGSLKQAVTYIFLNPRPIWFLTTLFAARIAFYLLQQFSDKLTSSISRILLWSSAVLLMPSFVIAYDWLDLHQKIGFPFSMDNVVMGLAFIVIGYWGKKLYDRLPRNDKYGKYDIVFLILFALAIVVGIYFGPSFNFCDAYYEEAAFFLFVATLVSFLVIALSKYMEKRALSNNSLKKVNGFLTLYGRNSLLIYIIHGYIASIMMALYRKADGVNYTFMALPFKYYVSSFVVSIIVITPILLLWEAVKKRCRAKRAAP